MEVEEKPFGCFISKVKRESSGDTYDVDRTPGQRCLFPFFFDACSAGQLTELAKNEAQEVTLLQHSVYLSDGTPGHWMLCMLKTYMGLTDTQASLHSRNPLRLIKHEDTVELQVVECYENTL